MKSSIIPYGKQEITEEDIQAVVETLRSDYLTQGPKIKEFEEKFSNYVGAKYAVAVSNATAALHLSALSLNIQLGDKVITSPITFVASANCVEYCKGEVVFADIDPETYLLDIKSVRNLLENSPKGTYKGIIPVDFAGRAINLEEYRKLADEFNLWIIEDACHAPGGYFIDSLGLEQKCGNGKFADLSVFSFHPVKHIACGEGGMITTNNELLYKKLLSLRSHGITREVNRFSNSSILAGGNVDEYPLWYMEMQELGYNYRLTDIQAALGISQVGRAKEILEKRKKLAQRYNEFFENTSFIKGHSKFIEGHAYHLYIIEIDERLGLYNFLRENNIYTQVHYYPCHLMPYYKRKTLDIVHLKSAEGYYNTCLSIPLFPSLKYDEQTYIITKIIEFYKQ